jgi:flagellar M-ring protein FliF
MALIKAENLAEQARGFYSLPLLRQVGLMAGLAASVAIGVAVVLWSQKPSYKLLYSNLAEQDSAAIVASLQKAGIDYELADGTAAILVPEGKVHEARLKLAGEGLPKGTGTGFELLENQKGFGISQFMENARYQHALEGELATTIASINTVRGARVHLAIPKQTAFVRNQKRPTASVMVDLYPGRSLSEDQVAAISHLVAAAVPNLDVDQVTIIDQYGHLLTGRETGEDMRLTATQFEHRKEVEDYYNKRIENILTPILGPGAVKAQVSADMDFTVTERTQESFTPDQQKIRSEQTVAEKTVGSPLPIGIPGALSNQPPLATAQPAGQPAQSAAQTQLQPGSSSERVTRNYELDKTISHSRMAGGVIRRLSAAVVVDDRVTQGQDGKPVRTPLSEEELARITSLVKEAIGFNAERGDSVNVINDAFTPPPAVEPLPPPSLLSRLDVGGLFRQLLAVAAVAFLLVGVLRPVLRDLAAKGKAPRVVTEGLSEDQVTLSGGQPALPSPGKNYEANLNAARTLAAQDPKRAAQVIKNWVSAE